jgi:circadian clock protein KaiC
MSTPLEFDRLSTGSLHFDAVLDGGVPAGAVVVVAGTPGTGKTVLSLQMMFSLARAGKRSLYVTTLSEPSLKLIRFMQQFDFFDPALLEDRIAFLDIGARARTESLDAALAQVKDRVEADGPALLVIDSSKALHDFVTDHAHARNAMYDLAVSAATWGATTLLVGEYSSHEFAQCPEFAIADGIIHLTNQQQEFTSLRLIEVTKMRGCAYVTGRHFFEITRAGFLFYPRVTAPVIPDGGELRPVPVPTGVPGLDELVDGGVPERSSTIIKGATGTGKTLLGLHFLVEGVRRREPGILFTLEETPDQLRGIARNFGWSLADMEREGLLTVRYTSPVELSTDRFLHTSREEARRLGARRIVVDSLTSAALGVASARRFQELVYALTKHLRILGATTVMTAEVAELLGPAAMSGEGLSLTSDNVILLRYIELQGRLDRTIAVLKARGVDLQSELRQFSIGKQGAQVGKRYSGMRGILTGMPSPVDGESQTPRAPGRDAD